MELHFIFGGDEGILYAVTPAGDLLYFKDEARDGTRRWACGGVGQKISGGWSQFRHIFSGGGGFIYAITHDGSLLGYQDLARDGTPGWAFAGGNGQRIGAGWAEFRHVFAGGDGILYAVNARGDLLWYKVALRQGAFDRRDGGAGRKIAGGWADCTHVLSGGGGIIYAVRANGDLLWYKDEARDGTARWAYEGIGQKIAEGWSGFTHVLSGGEGVIYAVKANGDLLWYKDEARDGTARWAWGGVGQRIGEGWEPLKISGYGAPLSVAPGENIAFKISASSRYTVTYLRLKKSAQGAVGIPMGESFSREGTRQTILDSVWETGCGWETDFVLTVPEEWPSGLYAARVVDALGSEFPIVFVVKPRPSARGNCAMLVNTNTWNAYNRWGGRNQYSDPFNASILSFERPNPAATPWVWPAQPVAAVPWDTLIAERRHLTSAELWLLNWLKDSGYRIDLYSDLDLHRGIERLRDYKALILQTHPEYWSSEMLDHLEAYLGEGGRLLYLGGNGLYERIQLNAEGHKMILRRGCPRFPRDLFRDQDPPRPERALLGVAFEWDSFLGGTPAYYRGGQGLSFAPYRVEMARHRFFRGTGLRDGDLIGPLGLNGAASGWEMDTSDERPNSGAPPANIQILARGTNSDLPGGYSAHMTYYDTPSGGWVFAAGSLSFGGSLVVDEKLQQIIRNALDECLG